MGTIDRLKADAEANCTMKRGDKVTLAGTGRRVIRRYTELALTPGA